MPGADGTNLLGETTSGVRLLTNRTTARERAEIAAGLHDGSVHIVVGTHALLHGDSPFTRLGLIVIDEHHRFGVEQREVLKQRAGALVPDVLVMTATPIPRTAALLVYGDLDLTVLAAMPTGREPVATEVLRGGTSEVDRAYARVREEVAAGLPQEAEAAVLASLNRFLNAPLKRKHVRRTAHQALDFVALED